MTQHNASDRFTEYYRKGRSSRWTAAWFAIQFVGKYEVGTTQSKAQEMCISVDWIESLARAAETYKRLKDATRGNDTMFRAVSEMRLKLSISHWAAMGRIAQQNDLTPLDVFAHLQWAATNGVSVEALRQQIRDESKPPFDWIAGLRRIINLMLSVAVDPKTPGWLRRWASSNADTLQKAAKKNEKLEV
jgi:hypothetical protein